MLVAFNFIIEFSAFVCVNQTHIHTYEKKYKDRSDSITPSLKPVLTRIS
jgi:hypothetical protein